MPELIRYAPALAAGGVPGASALRSGLALGLLILLPSLIFLLRALR